jgi:hypothetical protein
MRLEGIGSKELSERATLPSVKPITTAYRYLGFMVRSEGVHILRNFNDLPEGTSTKVHFLRSSTFQRNGSSISSVTVGRRFLAVAKRPLHKVQHVRLHNWVLLCVGSTCGVGESCPPRIPLCPLRSVSNVHSE